MENALINVVIKNDGGKLLVSSRDIAAGLEKRHADVVNKIKEVLTVREFSEREFITEKGNTYTECMLGKDAFILLVMHYTGYNDFKRAYIKRFNEMETELREMKQPDYSDLPEDTQIMVNLMNKVIANERALAKERAERERLEKQVIQAMEITVDSHDIVLSNRNQIGNIKADLIQEPGDDWNGW